jgi:peptidoglycan/LPS O-acetylase OafA/YrhL
VDRWIGEMSYPLYLLHQVTFYAAEPITRRLGSLGAGISVFVLPLSVAALVYALIERPVEAWRGRRFEQKLTQAENASTPVPVPAACPPAAGEAS